MLAKTPTYRPFIRAAGLGERCRRPDPSPHVPAHLTYLFSEIQRGWLRLVVDGEPHELTKGDQWLVVPDRTYHIEDTHLDLAMVYAHFTVDQNPCWSEIRGVSFNNAHQNRHLLQPPPLDVWGLELPPFLRQKTQKGERRSLRQIVAHWQEGTVASTLLANARLSELIAIWCAQAEKGSGPDLQVGANEERIARAETVAAQSVGAEFGVEEMAQIAGLTRNHFSVVYRKLRGQTPQQFLNKLRLDTAKRLLMTSKENIGVIANQLAYSNRTAFVRMFSRETGQSPSDWRKLHHLIPDKPE